MKKLIMIAMSLTMLTACEKWEELNPFKKKEKKCSTVNSESVPTTVSSAFVAKYPNTTVKTWFNKDDAGYCASFINNGNETLAFFDNNGSFQKEEIDGEDEGNYKDSKDDDKGCKCETDDED